MRHIKIYEDYTDEELRDLQDTLDDVGHTPRWTFGEDFGFGLAPKFKTEITGEEFPVISEKFFNYLLSKGYIVPKGSAFGFKNPEDFGIYKYFDAAIEPSPFPNRYVIHIRSKNPNLFTTRPEMVYVFAKVALELGKIRK